MIDKADPDLALFGDIVGANIAEFVEDLRAVDLVDLVSFIRFESFPTVEDLINSSTELFFRPEMLVFSWAACVDLRWDALPLVTLGLEFKHPDVSVFFNLTMQDAGQRIEILGVSFERPRLDPAGALACAFADARLGRGQQPSPVAALHQGGRRARKGLPWP